MVGTRSVQMSSTVELDTRGLLCPLPVLKAAKRLRAMEKGQTLALLADDPAAVVDVPHFCNESGNILVEAEALEDHNRFLIRKA
ncbi:MAG: sulfurtransferase TusA family protein [Pseudomonadota bacterium]